MTDNDSPPVDTPKSLKLKYEAGGVYGITINPHDTQQKTLEDDRMKKVRRILHKIFTNLAHNEIDYNIYFEVSEPTTVKWHSIGGRIHVHGIIRTRTKAAVRYLLINWLSMVASIGISYITRIGSHENLCNWDNYCKKQQHIINTNPLSSRHDPDELFDIIFDGLETEIGDDPKDADPPE